MPGRTVIAVGLLCGALNAQTSSLPPDILFLSRAIRHIGEGISAIPNYTCLETIARDQRLPNSPAFKRLDLLRIEVAKSGKHELFGWPGASKLEDRPISDFAGGGLMGNGVFALFADDLFVKSAGTKKVRGPEQLEGRKVIRVDYSVHMLSGSLTIQTATAMADVNWSGSWWADPETLDLVRLDVNADDIPPELNLAAVRISVGYGRANLAIFPRDALIEFEKTSGEISRDQIVFDNCRKFSGEAELILDAPDEPEVDGGPLPNPPKPVQTFTLPEGLIIPLRLQTGIDPRTAAVGDAITAIVERDVRDKRKLWLPKGAVVRGRIRRLDRRDEGISYQLVAVEFSEAQSGTDLFEFVAQLDSTEPLPGLDVNNNSIQARQATGRGPITQTTIVRYFEGEIPGTGNIYLTDKPYRIPADFRMTWKTQALRHQ